MGYACNADRLTASTLRRIMMCMFYVQLFGKRGRLLSTMIELKQNSHWYYTKVFETLL